MWGADFFLALAEYPGTGRNNGEFYEDLVQISSGSRLSHHGDLRVREIRQGFQIKGELNCLGCEFVWVNMTPQTNASDIERLNQVQFNCLTGWRSCKHPVDLAPTLWAQALRDEQDQTPPDDNPCLLPTQTLAREANDIALVKVLSAKSVRSAYQADPSRLLTVRILEPMKNARLHRTTDVLTFSIGADAIRPDDGKNRIPIVVGNEYFLLYQHLLPDQPGYPSPYLFSCHAVPNTPENAAEIQRGIALDPSAGEPYDYLDEPYSEQ
jgi:hypothetical protein